MRSDTLGKIPNIWIAPTSRVPLWPDTHILFDALLTTTMWALVKLPFQIAVVLGGKRGVIPRCKNLA